VSIIHVSVHHACVVTLVNDRICVHNFASKALEYIKNLILLDRGRFVSVHPYSTFSDRCQMATPQNAELQNVAKFGGFGARGQQNKLFKTKFHMSG